MLITMPVGRAVQALQALQKMGQGSFPAREAYWIARLTNRLQDHPDIAAADQYRNASIRKFGVEKEGMISVPTDKLAEFAAEYESVAVLPVDLEVTLLDLSILEHAPPMQPTEMAVLEPFFEVVQ